MYMYNFVFQGVGQLCCCASFVRVCAVITGWLRQLDRRIAASSRPAQPSHDRRPLQSRVHGMLFVYFSRYQSSYSDKNVQRCFTTVYRVLLHVHVHAGQFGRPRVTVISQSWNLLQSWRSSYDRSSNHHIDLLSQLQRIRWNFGSPCALRMPPHPNKSVHEG